MHASIEVRIFTRSLHDPTMQRREFLLTGSRACAALLAVPAIASLEGCASSKALALDPAEGSSILDVPLSAFEKNGSARIATKRLEDPLLVVKEADGTYRALLLKCPHKGGPIERKGDGFECPWHHSTFDASGNVTKGPAKTGLKSFPTTVNATSVQVDLGI